MKELRDLITGHVGIGGVGRDYGDGATIKILFDALSSEFPTLTAEPWTSRSVNARHTRSRIQPTSGKEAVAERRTAPDRAMRLADVWSRRQATFPWAGI